MAHHLTFHITTTQNSDKIFSAVSRMLHKNDYGVIFWMCSEEGFIEMGLVVKQEMKQREIRASGTLISALKGLGRPDYKSARAGEFEVEKLQARYF
jgi:hypothetical protein